MVLQGDDLTDLYAILAQLPMKHIVSKTKLRQRPSILLISKVTRRSLEIIVAKEERRKGLILIASKIF